MVFQKASYHLQAGHWSELQPSLLPRQITLWCPQCRQPITINTDPITVTPDESGQTATVNNTVACPGACGFTADGVTITGL